MFYRVLLLVLTLQMSFFAASAYTMPADKLLALSNRDLCDKAQAHWDKNELDSALICFNIAANRADKKQSREEMVDCCNALTAMANIYLFYFYDFERAMQCILKAEQIALKNDLTDRLAGIYFSMATLEAERTDITQDFAFSEQSLNLFKKAYYQSLRSSNAEYIQVLSIIDMTTIALWHSKLDLIQNELQSFQSAIINDTTIRERNYAKHLCAAAIYVQKQQYDSALNELNQIENHINHTRQTLRIIAHENIFFIYRDMKDRVAALNELNIIENIAQESHNIYAQIEALLLKRDYYVSLGKTALADNYDLEYHKVKDKFMTETKMAKVDEEKVLFKLNEANHEIKELSYKQRIQQTELIAVAVVALLLLALLMLAWLSHRRTKEKNRTLYLKNQQLLANIDRVRRMRQEQDTPTEKYGRGKMEGDDISQVMEKVERVMDESEEVYSTEFSLDRLAELTGETESRVSQAINTSGHKYYELLNEYRVREACRRLDDKEQYSGLTIEAIGQSVGFKSRSNFIATFKRLTGLTPSAYLKQPSKAKEQPNETKQEIST